MPSVLLETMKAGDVTSIYGHSRHASIIEDAWIVQWKSCLPFAKNVALCFRVYNICSHIMYILLYNIYYVSLLCVRVCCELRASIVSRKHGLLAALLLWPPPPNPHKIHRLQHDKDSITPSKPHITSPTHSFWCLLVSFLDPLCLTQQVR